MADLIDTRPRAQPDCGSNPGPPCRRSKSTLCPESVWLMRDLGPGNPGASESAPRSRRRRRERVHPPMYSRADSDAKPRHNLACRLDSGGVCYTPCDKCGIAPINRGFSVPMDVTPFSKNEASGRFFRRVDWAAFWTATVASFVVYFLTLGPSVTLEDSGELAVAGDYLGVPHPPG